MESSKGVLPLEVVHGATAPRDAEMGVHPGREGVDRAAAERDERYQRSEEVLRLALSASRQVEFEYDPTTDQNLLGPDWETVTGRSREEGSTLGRWRQVILPEDRPAQAARFRACLEGSVAFHAAEYRVPDPRGGVRWLRSMGRVTQRDAEGRPLRVSGTIIDVTEVHALQEALLEATRLASVGTLAAGVAHEINNPLCWAQASLREAMQRIDEGAQPGALRELLAEALDGTERIATIVKAMRSLGRPELPEQPHAVDLRAELHAAVHMVRNRVLARARLHVEVPEDLPPARARSSELGRVFVNLLMNAAQAIPEGDPAKHRVALVARARAGEVEVEVSDTGVGIAPDVQARMYEPFFTTKPPGVGTGLGLTIVRSIVEAAGGRIAAESAPGRGTTFRVTLAIAPPPPQPAASPVAPRAAGPRRRVLLVDDEELVTRSLRRVLRRHHDVEALTSPLEALRRIRDGESWDVVLCDFSMPEMNGISLYRQAGEARPELLRRWAFLTGGVFDAQVSRFLAENDVLTVAKPVDMPELLAVIERLASAGPTAP